ncbi:hypothetical protein DPMN_128105 [Dreissena polymorpha]|uniref:Uncharacterized protein n=1 Tax=Dreissena polymorpha TaxID=45954 RepID=A0A9D4GYX4_DREPO|nr:hypothetical protein DPMN_128105 [Dreissena polymorpha]
MWPLRMFTRKNTTPLGGNNSTNWNHFQTHHHIIGTNLLIKFHEDRTINVAYTMYSHIRKNAPPPGVHVFKATETIFKLVQNIIGTNLQTKFHDDWKQEGLKAQELTCSVQPKMSLEQMKNAPPPDIIGAILVTKFHENQTKKNAPPPWCPYIIGTNLLTKFHDDRAINVASRVKNAPPLVAIFFNQTIPFFILVQYISTMNFLTKFHENRTINVASRVLTRKKAPPPGCHFHDDWKINVASSGLTRKNAPPPGGNVFQPTGIIFELVQYIIGMNLLTKKNAPPLGNHDFQANVTIFELIHDIIETNLLTKFHED